MFLSVGWGYRMMVRKFEPPKVSNDIMMIRQCASLLRRNADDLSFIKALVSHEKALNLLTQIANDCSDAEAHSYITATLFSIAADKNALHMLIEEETKSQFKNITPLKWLIGAIAMTTSMKVWAEETYATEETAHPPPIGDKLSSTSSKLHFSI
jgi:hypothetical protein